MRNNKPHIPKLPQAFFKWYCKPDRYEELHGDLEEFFYDRVETSGLAKARWYYLYNVIRCCQPYAWKTSPRRNLLFTMVRNYYKTSLRSMKRNPLSTFINLFGLSVALGVNLVIFAYFRFDAQIDQHHQYKDEVFLTTFYGNREGTTEQYGYTPAPLGTLLREDVAGISEVARVKDVPGVVKQEELVFQENLRFVDPSFLDLLTFPLQWGDPAALEDPSQLILSAAMAERYFGVGQNPVGKEILIKTGPDRSQRFTVGGVAEPFPRAHAISFQILIPFENLIWADPSFHKDEWQTTVNATLVRLAQPSQQHSVVASFAPYQEWHNTAQPDKPIQGFGLVSIADLHNQSGDIIGDISFDITDSTAFALPILGIFILILACFNYINIAIVSASRRLKEIGVRKVIGAHRGKVVFQFLAENMLVTGLAALLGLGLALSVFLPWFVPISGQPLALSILDGYMWLFLVGAVLGTGIVSGLYPSLYISRFSVIKIFKGTVRFGRKNTLTKVFLSIQLIVACMLITGAVMFTQNSYYQANRDWGYNHAETLYTPLPDSLGYFRMEEVLASSAHTVSLAGASEHLGSNHITATVLLPHGEYEAHHLRVSPGYLETMDLELIQGRSFREDFATDEHAVIVNELFLKSMEVALGDAFDMAGERYTVVGVVEDFHSYNFYRRLAPTLFTVAAPAEYRYLALRTREGSQTAAKAALQQAWSSFYPEDPFQGGYQSGLYAGFYAELENMKLFPRTIAMVAVLLACLGLYGLVSLNVRGRVRELSIRKVLGAGLPQLSNA
ncbi:MAG TPA: hypothetical protein DCP28_16470, partial [Cytophagales bacterium]|nr:hypothetical protein [Cytophagales bacterium]